MKSRCPLCRAPSEPEFAPFCSQGCKDRDLLQWLDDGYRIPGPPVEASEGDPGDGDPDGLDSRRAGD